MDEADDWLSIEYRVFADFPRVFFVQMSTRWLFAHASFKESQEDSAPFRVFDMGAISPADLGRDWRSAESQAKSMLGQVTLTPDSFDETCRSSIRRSALEPLLV